MSSTASRPRKGVVVEPDVRRPVRATGLCGEPSEYRLRLALGDDRRQLLVDDGTGGELLRQDADGDAAGRGGGLEAGGDVDGVAGEETAAGGGVDVEAHEGFAGVDADARFKWRAVGANHALERLNDAQARADSALGIVLVHGGHAEDADHGVADELLDSAAVGLDHSSGGGMR